MDTGEAEEATGAHGTAIDNRLGRDDRRTRDGRARPFCLSCCVGATFRRRRCLCSSFSLSQVLPPIFRLDGRFDPGLFALRELRVPFRDPPRAHLADVLDAFKQADATRPFDPTSTVETCSGGRSK